MEFKLPIICYVLNNNCLNYFMLIKVHQLIFTMKLNMQKKGSEKWNICLVIRSPLRLADQYTKVYIWALSPNSLFYKGYQFH